MLGVWLSHDPADFGLTPIVPPPPAALTGSMRTGLTEALLTDAEDDSYDLSWLHRLPSDMRSQRSASFGAFLSTIPIPSIAISCSANSRIAYTARVTSSHPHLPSTTTRAGGTMPKWRESGQRSSRSSARFPSSRPIGKWRSVSRKSRTGSRRVWWVERGLTLYGEHAARPESVDDLRKRLTAYQAKLTAPTTPARKAPPKPHAAPAVQTIEVLVCENCGGNFDRVVIRGRKPKNCPGCRRPERTAGVS